MKLKQPRQSYLPVHRFMQRPPGRSRFGEVKVRDTVIFTATTNNRVAALVGVSKVWQRRIVNSIYRELIVIVFLHWDGGCGGWDSDGAVTLLAIYFLLVAVNAGSRSYHSGSNGGSD